MDIHTWCVMTFVCVSSRRTRLSRNHGAHLNLTSYPFNRPALREDNVHQTHPYFDLVSGAIVRLLSGPTQMDQTPPNTHLAPLLTAADNQTQRQQVTAAVAWCHEFQRKGTGQVTHYQQCCARCCRVGMRICPQQLHLSSVCTAVPGTCSDSACP